MLRSLQRSARVAAALTAASVTLLVPSAEAGDPGAAVPPVRGVPAGMETVPVSHSGDAADDPAIWVHPSTPALSLVIGNDKKGALETYRLDGSRHQRITTGRRFWGNVDVRQRVIVGGRTRDVVATTNGGMRFYTVDPANRMLVPITDGGGSQVVAAPAVDGACLYHAPNGSLYFFVVARTGLVRQFLVHDNDGDGLLQTTLARSVSVGSEAEGCVADDVTGRLYVSEEEVGLWRFAAAADGSSSKTLVDRVGSSGHLVYDVEGVTVADDYLIVSAQHGAVPRNSYFTVYDRTTNAYVGAFRIVASASTDGCQRTDGITAYAGTLGPTFPRGVFICQDNTNSGPGPDGNQDFKLTRLETVLDLD